MEDFRIRDQRLVHFLRGQAGIRAGLPGKTEVPVPGCVQGNKSKGRKHLRISQNSPGIDSRFLKRSDQRPAEGIIAHFADHGSLAAVPGQCRQEIARSASGIGGQDRISRLVGGIGSKIDQQFPECNHIILFHFLYPVK